SSATAKPKAILTKQIGASVENDAKLSAFISSKINLAIDKRIRAISDHYKAADIIPADNYASLEFTSVPAEVGTASIPRVNFSSANVGRSVDPVSISNPNKNDLDKLQQQLNELQIQLSSIINILQDNSGFLTSKKSIENQFAEIGGYALSSYLGNSFGLNATYVANPNLQISIALMIGILLFGFVIEGRTTRKKVPNEYISEELIDNPNDEYDFMGSTEGIPARMNLARAYFDMGFPDKARKVLTDIATRGDASQKKEARSMLMDLDN
ncbi:MAG: FimV/HubP family polar landmark protein, partial [Pseudomonadota bacterium]|nr:FimV/HubP family polar landmark protein [Pseudomonadota bacterium]